MEYKTDFKSNKTAANRVVSSGAQRSRDMQEHTLRRKRPRDTGGPSPQPLTLDQGIPSPARDTAEGEADSELFVQITLNKVIKQEQPEP